MITTTSKPPRLVCVLLLCLLFELTIFLEIEKKMAIIIIVLLQNL